MSTIPASQLVQVTPSVLTAGGSSLDVIGLMLTSSTRVPIGTVPSFPDQPSVAAYFGAGSTEDTLAGTYFGGFDGASKLPGALLFAQYNASAVAAYLRGGDVSAYTLAQLQAITGSLSVTFDGVARTAVAVNLAAATSFSSAAGIIQTALNAASPVAASVTGSIGGVVTASAGASFTATGSGTNLTVSGISGVLHVGAAIAGTGVPSGTYIVSQTSGTAGSNGVYVTNHATTSAGDALTATSNTLDVTALSSGTLQATDAVSGTGVAAGTTVLAQISGSPGGIGLYTLSSAQRFASATVTSLSTVLNVTAVGSGTVEVGAVLTGTSVTSGTEVTAQITGTGGTGTYRVSAASTTVSETITASAADVAVTYDSVSAAFTVTSGITGASSTAAFATGTISAALKLTSATGAQLSQGAALAVPATFMNAVIAVTQDWVTFMTTFDPDSPGEITVKEAFAAWKNTKNDRFAYICADTDPNAATQNPASASLGRVLAGNSDSGTSLQWAADYASAADLCAFVCGVGASIDFDEFGGRITFAYKKQAGFAATVTDGTSAQNLLANGYNFYGAYGSANINNFVWLQNGTVTGDFRWLDAYVNQVWLNNQFQTALLNVEGNSRSIPFSPAGYSRVEAALSDPIIQALDFGAFGPDAITDAQSAEVRSLSGGIDIRNALETQGYYVFIGTASPSLRAARGPLQAKFFYVDQGAIQTIDLSSIALQ